MLGYAFALLATVSFGALGLLGKVAERNNCKPSVVTLVLFASSAAIMGISASVAGSGSFPPPSKIVVLAAVFGVMASVGGWVFLYGLRFGKITTSWVVINLSGAVPAAASTFFYAEELGFRKLLLLCLVFASILFLWKDMRDEDANRAKVTAREGEVLLEE